MRKHQLIVEEVTSFDGDEENLSELEENETSSIYEPVRMSYNRNLRMLDNNKETASEMPFSVQTEKIFDHQRYTSGDSSGRGLIGEGLLQNKQKTSMSSQQESRKNNKTQPVSNLFF